MSSKSSTALVAYVGAPHAGYLKLFRAYEGAVLYVLGDEFIREFISLVRHLPGVTPGEARTMVSALGIFSEVRILTPTNLPHLREFSNVVMPDEDVSHSFVEKHLEGLPGMFDGRWKLRWDWGQTQKKLIPDGRRVTQEAFAREIMKSTFEFAASSSDWWRQIGASLWRDGNLLLGAFNKHLPNEQIAYFYGDPRSNFEPGVSIDASVSGHAEARLLALASARGICTKGCELYVSTFPCPPCANHWCESGITRLYYAEGYALLHAADVLDAKGIEIVRVDMTTPS